MFSRIAMMAAAAAAGAGAHETLVADADASVGALRDAVRGGLVAAARSVAFDAFDGGGGTGVEPACASGAVPGLGFATSVILVTGDDLWAYDVADGGFEHLAASDRGRRLSASARVVDDGVARRGRDGAAEGVDR